MTDLLIADLDGTLVDSFDDIRSAIIVAFESIDVEPTDALLALCRRGVSLELWYTRATGIRPTTDAELAAVEDFVGAYRDHYLANQNPVAFDGVADTLQRLRAERPELRIAIATTKRTDMARAVAEKCGILGAFDYVRGSDGLPKKPDPALLHAVADHLDIPIERAVMVGDTDKDVLAAQRAGCRAVAVTYGGWTRDEMATLEPDHIIDSFTEVFDLVSTRSP